MPQPQPYNIGPMYQPVAGKGSYGEYFTEAPAPLMPIDMAPTAGLGAMNVTPQAWLQRPPRKSGALRTAASFSPILGALGQAADAAAEKTAAEQTGDQATATKAAVLMTVIALGLMIRGGAGYIVGKAVAPTPESEAAYAWGGVFASVFLGALGLGIVGAVALSRR